MATYFTLIFYKIIHLHGKYKQIQQGTNILIRLLSMTIYFRGTTHWLGNLHVVRFMCNQREGVGGRGREREGGGGGYTYPIKWGIFF